MSPARPTRIGYFAPEFPRPTETFIRREITAVRSAGLEVRPFAVHRPDDVVSDEQSAFRDETTYLLPASAGELAAVAARWGRRAPGRLAAVGRLAAETSPPGAKQGLYQGAYLAEATVLADLAVRHELDHLHAHFGDRSTSIVMLAAALADVPFSFTLHGPAIFWEPHVWRLDAKIGRAAFVSTISWFARSQAQLFGGEDAASRCHLIHCGVEPDRYGPAPTVADGEFPLVFVARTDHVKGLTVLLEAVRDLSERVPGWSLRIAGDGPDRTRFEALADELGVADRVTFLGNRSADEVARLLATSAAYVLPSFAEGVPVGLMEASAAGLPVVTTPVGGITELVTDGVTGRLVPPGNAAALTDALAELAADPGLRARLGAAGRARVVEEFDAGIEGRRLARLFAEPDARGGPVRPEPLPVVVDAVTGAVPGAPTGAGA